ncbi:MAG: 6-pyruvoyl trahydropterin synthase family protein [Candidatus Odinarchaeia archaeon]
MYDSMFSSDPSTPLIFDYNQPRILVTKEFEFDASHQLENPDFSQKWNKDTFGKCNNLHGHRFKLVVTVLGTPDSKNGMVINFNKLKKIVNSKIIDKLDHSNLNEFCKLPTCENLIVEIWKLLEKELPLYSLKLYETPTSYAEIRTVL